MPKVTGPLFSVTASGTLGKTLTYQNKAGGHVVRTPPSHTPPHNENQEAHKALVRFMIRAWSGLDDYTKSLWNQRGPAFGMSGFKLWWRQWFLQNSNSESYPTLP